MESLKLFLKVLALVLWFIGFAYAGFVTLRRTGDGSVVVNSSSALACAGLFCWNLADFLK